MMLKLAILSVLVAYISARPSLDGSRIVNGTDAKLGEIPYIISLRQYGSHNCGGSILDQTHILTAAHCVVGSRPSTLTVQYGELSLSSQKNLVAVAEIYTHEDYSPGNNWANDIAVLKLADDIVYSENVQPVTLPEQDEKLPGGDLAVVSGWGLQKSGGSVQNTLKRVDITLYTDADCKAYHGSRVDLRHHVCAGVPEGGKGECNGDSGGPLTANGKEWGVVSWSVKPCTRGGPGVFARVPSFINWIKEKQLL